MAVINRKIDSDIHTELNTGTQTKTMTQTTKVAFLADILQQKALLGLNSALDEEPYALITPGWHANLMQLDQFTSHDYINLKPFENVSKSRAFNWLGVNWIVDQGLPGAGTASAKCFMYAKKAIGHACNTAGTNVEIGFDRKNEKSWARTSIYLGSKVLQNTGIIVFTHDDTDLALT